MNNIIRDKINIGISACQYGCKVRYNGKGWDMMGYLGREKQSFTWHPVCPEVMSGMGVLRPSIRLQSGNGNDVWDNTAKVKNKNGQDVTQSLKRGATVCLDTVKSAGVEVFVYMEGSPSCGVYRTTLKNKRLGKPPGVFGSLLLKEEMFLIPAVDLQSPIKWWDWKRRMLAFSWFKNQPWDRANEITEVWHIMKFLCQELSRSKSDLIGKKLANVKELSQEELAEIRSDILLLLREPSDIRRIKQWLWKNYSFLKKKHGVEVEEVMNPAELRNMHHIAEEVLQIEIESRKEEILFGSSPIIYKPER